MTKEKSEIAVIGGGGFVGARLVRLAQRHQNLHAIPILRGFHGLARLGFAMSDCRIVDTSDVDALSGALEGASSVVNLTMGSDWRIMEDAKLVYSACARAKVRQLIYLSSAAVF